MPKTINPDDDLKVEKAIKFLVKAIATSGNNSKPVILHSIRVAFFLEREGYSNNTVVAALLHDLVEDSAVTLEEIGDSFGQEIQNLVSTLTFDPNISDKKQRYEEVFDRSLKAGKESLLIRTADILDNSNYYLLAKDDATKQFLFEKMKCFLDISQPIIGDEPLWKGLFQQYQRLKKNTVNK